MIWSLIVIALVLLLAYFIRKAVKGTVFRGKCPCTPYVEHLRWLEGEPESRQIKKKENLW